MRRLADAERLRRFLKELARDADAESSFRKRLEDLLASRGRPGDQETPS